MTTPTRNPSLLDQEAPRFARALVRRGSAWIRGEELDGDLDSTGPVDLLHHTNRQLWDAEDKVRNPSLSDAEVRVLKRRIDRLNQHRNDLIEQIDEALLAVLSGVEGGEMQSESVGMLLDRISVIGLRLAATRMDPTRLAPSAAQAVFEQATDLLSVLERYLSDLQAGRKMFKLYRRHKTYGSTSAEAAR